MEADPCIDTGMDAHIFFGVGDRERHVIMSFSTLVKIVSYSLMKDENDGTICEFYCVR